MKVNERITQLTQRWKPLLGKYRPVLLVILAGLVLLALPTGGGGEEDPPPEPQAAAAFDLPALEARLAQALSRIHGAGEVTVVLTVCQGPRTVLAQNSDREEGRGESTETVVLSRGSGIQEAVPVQELYPAYQGALLVCPGGNDPEVRLKLTEALSALTGLGADKISISQGK